jgi:hypothetical protein
VTIHIYETPPKKGTEPRKGYKPGLSKALVGLQPNGEPYTVGYVRACTPEWRKELGPETGFLLVVEIDTDLTDKERATWTPPVNAPSFTTVQF